ncbi:clotting factor C-like, partial [Hyalella azteca]|uniref:Clotting factor C-like n=1 Tax=Hyalella azteca TaxID=294128 RepID=A0A8B7P6W4_HYAAZ
NFGTFERTKRSCLGKKKVPVLTVVLAECWGSATLALRCHSDGLWGLYGEAAVNATQPRMRFVCQPRHLNPPICGRKPRYRSTGTILQLDEFQTPRNLSPWLQGLKKRERYECSATLISDSWLLTAAHCVARSLASRNRTMDPRDLKVQLTLNPRDDKYHHTIMQMISTIQT